MKRLADKSQNFIRSPAVINKLLPLTSLHKNDLVFDIGAGSGVITSTIAPKVKRVVSVEIDSRLIKTLVQNTSRFPNVTVIEADYLELKAPSEPFKVFANIPFHISSKIIKRWVLEPGSPEAAYLIVQKQFGQKLVANDTSHFTSQLGMCIGARYDVRIIKKLQRSDFMPMPAVDVVCISLERRPVALVTTSEMADFVKFTEDCFSSRQNLAKTPLHIINATPGVSPSSFTIYQWVKLFEASRRTAQRPAKHGTKA